MKCFNNNFKDYLRIDNILIREFDEPFTFKNDYDITFNYETKFDESKNKNYIDEITRNDIYQAYQRRVSRMYENIENSDKTIFVRTNPGFKYYDYIFFESYNKEKDIERYDDLKDIFKEKILNVFIYNEETLSNFIKRIENYKNDKDVEII